MDKRLKTAIVGLGVIGNVHKRIIEEQRLNLVAVCDVDGDKLANINGVQKFTDYTQMLNQIKPDVVHICTPHYLHAEMIVEALNKNINVLCEKPICIKEEDIERVLDAEKSSKAILGVCHQNRFNEEIIFLKDYLKGKTIISGNGNVVWHRDKNYYGSAEWRGKWNTEGGGLLINQALHTLDLMQWLIGMPTELTATISNLTLKNNIEVEDTASIICTGEKNFTLLATNGSSCDFPININVLTNEEYINLLGDKIVIGNKVYSFDKESVVYGKRCYGTGHDSLIRNFYNCVRTGKKFEIDGNEAVKVIRIILATYKSSGDRKII